MHEGSAEAIREKSVLGVLEVLEVLKGKSNSLEHLEHIEHLEHLCVFVFAVTWYATARLVSRRLHSLCMFR